MIRLAQPRDEAALLEMGRAFNEEAGYTDVIPFDELSFKVMLGSLGAAGLLFVADNGSQVVGMAAADVAPAICNRGVRVGREVFWYLRPGHRNGGGKSMLAALECAAKSQGATFFDVVAEDGKRSTALARIYRAAGYSPAESVFRKRL